MIEARAGHTATLLPDGTVLVAGGTGGTGGTFAAGELYDPSSGTWSATGDMIKARTGHTATLLPDGRVLVAGGAARGVALASAELYDPDSGTWTATGKMTEARTDHTATLLPDGTVLVASGQGNTGDGGLGSVWSAELYDPESGTWTATAEIVDLPGSNPQGGLLDPRFHHTATLLPDGTVLVAGGFGFQAADALASAELYDPSSRTWTATGGMRTARNLHTATLLPDGRVLVAGGGNVSTGLGGGLASAELYDPGSGTWTASGNMIEPRFGHTATLLPDGRVLVAGGFGASTVELYDPGTGTWTAAGDMSEARGGHTATLLPDGRLLLAGGGSSGGPLASAELYDPGSGT